jgi:ubiquitin C-terminal hydrolase
MSDIVKNLSINNKPLGIRNEGWNCYINSVFQILSCSKFITDFIEKYNQEDEEVIKTILKYKLKLVPNIEDIIDRMKLILSKKEELNMGHNEIKHIEYLIKHYKYFYSYISFKNFIKILMTEQNKTLTLSEFIKVCEICTDDNHYSHLFRGEQNDPCELFSYLFEMIHDCKSRYKNIKFNILEENCEEHKIVNLYKTDYKKRFEKEYSHCVSDLFFYTLKIIKCHNCRNITYSVSPEHLLALPIPNKAAVSIFDCFTEFTKVQPIEDYKCDNCKQTNSCYIEMNNLTKSKTLTIQLLRFNTGYSNYNVTKNNTKVDYPLNLDIRDYVLSKSVYNYKLYGIILHFGSIYGGHYIAIVKKTINGNDKWFICDDTNIRETDVSNVLNNENAYILFYQSE